MPAPLAVILHGAGGSARRVLSLFSVADELGVIVLAPESRGSTWDAIRGGFGPDIEFLDRALSLTFDRCAVDRNRVPSAAFRMARRTDSRSALPAAISLRTSWRARQASSAQVPSRPAAHLCFSRNGRPDSPHRVDEPAHRPAPRKVRVCGHVS